MTELSVSKKLKAIFSGWYNYASGQSTRIEIERAQICAKCPHAVHGKLLTIVKDELKEIEGMKCDLCGCPLSAKIRQNEEPCDLGKW